MKTLAIALAFVSSAALADTATDQCLKGVLVGMVAQQQVGKSLTVMKTETAVKYLEIVANDYIDGADKTFSLPAAATVYGHAVANDMPQLDRDSFIVIAKAYFTAICTGDKK